MLPSLALALAAALAATPAPDLRLRVDLGATRLSTGSGGDASSRSVYGVTPALDIPVTVAAFAGALVPNLYSSDLIHPRCPCDRAEVNPVDRFAIGYSSDTADYASTATVALAVAAPVVGDVLAVGWSRALFEDAVVYAEALGAATLLVEVTKYAVQRPLPRTYAGDPDLVGRPGGYRSFYSGHVTTAFTALTTAAWTMRLRYGEQGWPWAVVGLVGASVAVERVAAGRHFPSDTVVGAATGLAIGTVIPLLHGRGGDADRRGLSMVPSRRGLVFAASF